MPCFPWFIYHPKSDYILQMNYNFCIIEWRENLQPGEIWGKKLTQIELWRLLSPPLAHCHLPAESKTVDVDEDNDGGGDDDDNDEFEVDIVV